LVLPIAGVLGIGLALAWEKWRRGDGSVLMAVCASYFVMYAFVTWGSPHPALRSFIGAILIGGTLGAILSMLLWRIVPQRWFAGPSPKTAARGAR
jgi:hypothetical protein